MATKPSHGLQVDSGFAAQPTARQAECLSECNCHLPVLPPKLTVGRKENNMMITISRVKELTGKAVSLDIYVNGKVCGKVAPSSLVKLSIDAEEAEVFVKTNWCESNRVMVSSDSRLKAYAKGGLLGATFNSLFRPKSAYVLEKE